eukprot:scaffold11110_cov74-Skeletonema_marinoi.AAC.1
MSVDGGCGGSSDTLYLWILTCHPDSFLSEQKMPKPAQLNSIHSLHNKTSLYILPLLIDQSKAEPIALFFCTATLREIMMNDAIYHESDVEDDQEEAEMMLPPPPPPAYIKLLDRRCLSCVINYLDAESTESMAQSCRFLSDACDAADRTPLMGTQHAHQLSEAASPQPSFDVLDGLLQDIVNMQHDSRGVQASISDNPASSSFDETDQMKSAELPSSDRRLSLDDSVKQDYDSGVQAFINHNPAPSFDETDEVKSAASPSCDDTSSSDD